MDIEPTDNAIGSLLVGLSTEWQAFDLDNLGPFERTALVLCNWSGLVEWKLLVKAWSETSGIQCRCVVSGKWQKALPDHICAAVPSWKGRPVNAQPDPAFHARLTIDGVEAKNDLGRGGMHRLLALTAAKINVQPARISIRIVGEDVRAPGVVGGSVATAQATASVGDIVIQNNIDLSAIERLITALQRGVTERPAAEGESAERPRQGQPRKKSGKRGRKPSTTTTQEEKVYFQWQARRTQIKALTYAQFAEEMGMDEKEVREIIDRLRKRFRRRRRQ